MIAGIQLHAAPDIILPFHGRTRQQIASHFKMLNIKNRG